MDDAVASFDCAALGDAFAFAFVPVRFSVDANAVFKSLFDAADAGASAGGRPR